MKQIIKGTKNILINKKWEIIIFLYVILSLHYVVKSGFMADDGIYYFLKGNAIYNNENLFQMILNSIQGWIQQGRFFPFSSYAMVVFYYLTNPVIYKLVSIICVAINVLMFGNLVEKITESKRIKYILMLLSTLFFQIIAITPNTGYSHNAILSYHMFMQIMFGLLMLILIYLHKYIYHKKKVYFIFSIIFLIIALLTYEIGFIYIFIIFFFLVYYWKNDIKPFKLALLYAIPVFIIGMINVYLKLKFTTSYQGSVASFDLYKILVTDIKQNIAAVPLSNYFFRHHNTVLSSNLNDIVNNIDVKDIIITVIFIYLTYQASKIADVIKPLKNKISFGLFALSVYIFPGVLIAITKKYQNELYWGIAHLPVYLQYFGLLLTFYWIFIVLRDVVQKYNIKSVIKRIFKILGFTIIIFITLMNQQNTRLYIDASNNTWLYPKEIGINAMHSGIFNDVTEEDIVFVKTVWPWDVCNSVFFTQYSKKKITSSNIDGIIKEVINESNGAATYQKDFTDTYVIDYNSNEFYGIVKLGLINNIEIQGDTKNIYTSKNKIFIFDKTHMMRNIYYQYKDEDNVIQGIMMPLDSLTVLNGVENGLLYQIDEPGLISFDSIKLST